jgi:recombinational DNA repair protein (RecF pathway)
MTIGGGAVERVYRDRPEKHGGGLKDMARCEHCGRPIKITSDDCTREEILCPCCAAEARVAAMDDYETSR